MGTLVMKTVRLHDEAGQPVADVQAPAQADVIVWKNVGYAWNEDRGCFVRCRLVYHTMAEATKEYAIGTAPVLLAKQETDYQESPQGDVLQKDWWEKSGGVK